MTHTIGKNLRNGGLVFAALILFGLSGCGSSGASPFDDDACADIDCSNRGSCVPSVEGPRCICQSGYHAVGTACEVDLCTPENCLHGHCTDPQTTAACTCDEGYSGDICGDCAEGYIRDGLICVAEDPDKNPCIPDPCSAHGQCRVIDATSEFGGFVCDCDPHFTGQTCGNCALGYEGDACDQCSSGYHAEGDACVQNSPCVPDPCVHGTCSENNGLALCGCDAGYEGRYCDRCAKGYVMSGLVCVPENPSDPCTPNPCLEGAGDHRTTCRATGESFECLCEAGYHEDGDACVEDVVCDPATTCSGHGQCTGQGLACACDDEYAGAHCDECADGFKWEGDICVDDPSSPCAGAVCGEPHKSVCVAEGEAYRCTCESGYSLVADVCVADCDVDAELCADANPSFGTLVSSNGHGAVILDLDSRKAVGLYEHIYKTWGENQQGKLAMTRDMLYDTYFGVRINGSGTWMHSAELDYAGYYAESGVAQLVQYVGAIKVESFYYAPFELGYPALVMLTRITNTGQAPASVSAYTLHNYHLGYTQDTETETGIDPNAENERIVYDVTTGSYLETGPGGAMVHYPIGEVDHFGAAAAGSDANPYIRLSNGQNLGDETEVAQGTDRACGFQKGDVELGAGESLWTGAVSAFARDGNANALVSVVESAFGETNAERALADAIAEWEAWRKAPPEGLSPAEKWIYRVSEAVLRMSQVREQSDLSYGQILASLPPGQWAISWVRDMSYSIAALIEMGHYTEAKAALEFMLKADSGFYTEEVGVDYQITVCRYYGNGTEETDFNQDGPNIEFDGFGLFLWVLGEYVRSTGDTSLIDDYWPLIRDEIAGALVSLIDDNDMIAPDSSIWEVHWNGKQKQFTYTSLAAARGLCDASILADLLDDGVSSQGYLNASERIVSGIRAHALDGNFLVQSVEEFQADVGYVDAAVVDAFNWMLFDPTGNVATDTLNTLQTELAAAHGNGYFRNDDGGEYDSKEWVFIDMRMASALRAAGHDAKADALIDWITAQAINNLGLIAELHHPQTAAYDGAIPMAGFGAGAYILNLWMRENGVTPWPACWDNWPE